AASVSDCFPRGVTSKPAGTSSLRTRGTTASKATGSTTGTTPASRPTGSSATTYFTTREWSCTGIRTSDPKEFGHFRYSVLLYTGTKCYLLPVVNITE